MMAIAIEHNVSRFMLGTSSKRGKVVDAPRAATLVARGNSNKHPPSRRTMKYSSGVGSIVASSWYSIDKLKQDRYVYIKLAIK